MSYPSCHIHHPSLINPSQKPTPSTPSRLLLLAKKLCGKVALVDLADALNIPVEHAREFALEHERRRKVGMPQLWHVELTMAVWGKLKVCGGYLGPCWVRSYNVSSVIEGEDLNPQFGVKHGSRMCSALQSWRRSTIIFAPSAGCEDASKLETWCCLACPIPASSIT